MINKAVINPAKSYCFYFLFLLVLACTNQHPAVTRNSLSQQKLKGTVKTMTEFWFYASEVDGVPTTKSLDSKILKKYDEKGNLTGEIVYDNRTTRKVIDSFVYTNSDSGQLLKAMLYNGDGSLHAYYVYTYNKNGTLKDDTRYFENGKKHTQNLYKYDGMNLMEHKQLVFKEYNTDVTEHLTRHFYNKQAQRIESRSYDEERLKFSVTFYEYDSKGNIQKESGKYLDGREYKNDMEYDSDGNEIELQSSWGTTTSLRKSSYEEPDKQGNWQNRLMYSEGILNQIVHREFSYY